MKVLSITPAFYPSKGGIEQVVYELARRARDLGYFTDVAHLDVSCKQVEEGSINGVRFFRLPMRGGRLLGLAPALRKLVRNYDLLHVHDPQLLAITANVQFFGRGLPAVLSTHGGFWHTRKFALPKSLYEKFFLSASLRRYRRILATSVADQEYFAHYSGNVVLCNNGVSIERFAEISLEGSGDVNSWIYWGRLSRNKRIDQVIDIVSLAKARGHRIRLLICGGDFDGILTDLRSKVARLELQDNVRFAPYLDEAALLYELGRCGVFITASDHEGFGLSVVEAMAAGRIVICKDISPLNTFVQHGVSGFFLNFDGGEKDSFLLKDLLSMNDEQRASISEAAVLVAEKYNWNEAVANFCGYFEAALNC